MPIVVNLDVMLAKRKRRLGDLAEAIGISIQNLSILKNGQGQGDAVLYSGRDLPRARLPAR